MIKLKIAATLWDQNILNIGF